MALQKLRDQVQRHYDPPFEMELRIVLVESSRWIDVNSGIFDALLHAGYDIAAVVPYGKWAFVLISKEAMDLVDVVAKVQAHVEDVPAKYQKLYRQHQDELRQQQLAHAQELEALRDYPAKYQELSRQHQEELREQQLTHAHELEALRQQLTIEKKQPEEDTQLKDTLQSVRGLMERLQTDAIKQKPMYSKLIQPVIGQYQAVIDAAAQATTPDTIQAAIKSLQDLAGKIQDNLEDVAGAVRVIVRIRDDLQGGAPYLTILPGKTAGDVVVNSSDVCDKGKRFGEFFRAFTPEWTTAQIYAGVLGDVRDPCHSLELVDKNELPRGFSGLFDQVLRSQQHVFVFAYGYSGSGKTFTVFGNDTNRGIFQLGVQCFLEQGATVHVMSALDMYGNTLIGFESGKNEPPCVVMTALTDYGSAHLKSVDDVNNFMRDVNAQRKTHQYVKPTLNNPESSRASLFVTVRVDKGDKHGFLTFVDMAGRENPYNLLDDYFVIKTHQNVSIARSRAVFRLASSLRNLNVLGTMDDTLQLKVKNTVVPVVHLFNPKMQRMLPDVFKNDIDKLKHMVANAATIIAESFFINQSINNLTDYLLEQQGKPAIKRCTIKSYKTKNPHPDTYCELDIRPGVNFPDNLVYEPEYQIPLGATGKINGIIDLIHSLKQPEMDAKYVMMCAVREGYGENNKFVHAACSTLEFAESISSLKADYTNVR